MPKRTQKPVGPLAKAPACPSHLPKAGHLLWRDTCAYLLNRELLHSGDLATVEAFVRSVVRARKIDAELEGEPLFVDGKTHPGVSASNQSATTVAKLAALLGLAPMSRSRLTKAARVGRKTASADDDWLRVLEGGKK